MAKITPVTGYIVKQSRAAEVVSPAYDALTPEGRTDYVTLHPLNFLNTMRSADEFSLDQRPASYDEILKINAANLEALLVEDVFEEIAIASYYIYRLEIGEHSQTGLIAEIPIEEYTQKRILIHENTREVRERQLSRYLMEVGASSSPVCLSFAADMALQQLLNRLTYSTPLLDFTAEDGLHQQLWEVADKDTIQQITDSFAMVRDLYLTDGHHRCAAGAYFAEKVKQSQKHQCDASFTNLLTAIFPDNEMRILAYHRSVRDLGDMTEKEFIAALDQYFVVEHLHVNYPDEAEPRKKGEFTMYLDGYWYRLSVRDAFSQSTDPVKSLDVSILEDCILRPLLGIEDMRADPRLDYLPGTNGLRDFEERSEEGWRLMLGCFPTSMEEMYAVADNDMVMPPKSTWFDPKVRSGIFLKLREHQAFKKRNHTHNKASQIQRQLMLDVID